LREGRREGGWEGGAPLADRGLCVLCGAIEDDDGAVRVLPIVHVGAVVSSLEAEDGGGGGPYHLGHVVQLGGGREGGSEGGSGDGRLDPEPAYGPTRETLSLPG
jgi:hypothetical protein